MNDLQRVYKIAPAALWQHAVSNGVLHGSADDERDGFIHLSSADQLAGTLAKHFRNQPDLLLIAFDCATLGTALKWEPSRDGALFPHFYGPIPVSLALWQRRLALGGDGVATFDLSDDSVAQCDKDCL